jgi:hypothetical protein
LNALADGGEVRHAVTVLRPISPRCDLARSSVVTGRGLRERASQRANRWNILQWPESLPFKGSSQDGASAGIDAIIGISRCWSGM